MLWPSIGEYPCYDPFLYQTLTSDAARNQRFRVALQKLARGKVVLDIGTGQDLIWAREAVAAGAGHVLALEVMEESFLRGSENLRSLRLQDDITLLQGGSTSLHLDPKADVCVAEIIGSVAGAEGAAVVLADARRRHLAPGGIVVPHRCVTRAAAVCLRDVLGGNPVSFSQEAIKYLQVIFDWNEAPFDVRMRIKNAAPAAVLSNSEPVEILNFNGDLLEEQERRVSLTMNRPGKVDGILTWLELSCLPDEPPLDTLHMDTSWGSVYFPLFDSEIPVEGGDVLGLTFRTSLGEDRLHPNYRLEATLRTDRTGEHSADLAAPHRGRTFRDRPVYRVLFPE